MRKNNANNSQKVLVTMFSKKCTMIVLCNNKCVNKIRSLGDPLALCFRTKARWVEKEVKVITADNNIAIKSPFVLLVSFNIDMLSILISRTSVGEISM